MQIDKLNDLITVLGKRGDFSEKIWLEHKAARNLLLEDALVEKQTLSELLKKFNKSQNPAVIYNIREILKEVEDADIGEVFEEMLQKSKLVFTYNTEEKKSLNKYRLEFQCKSTKELIVKLGKHGSRDWPEYRAAYSTLLKREEIVPATKEVFHLWLELLNFVNYDRMGRIWHLDDEEGRCLTKDLLLFSKTHNEVFIADMLFDDKNTPSISSRYVVDYIECIIWQLSMIVSVVGDDSFVSLLRKILEGYLSMGITKRTVASTLLKLGDSYGVEWLVEKIRNPSIHAEMRLNCVLELVRLGISEVFHANEVIDLSRILNKGIATEVDYLTQNFLKKSSRQ